MALSDRLNLVGGEVPLNELRAIVDLLSESASRFPYLPAGGDVGAEIDAMITSQLASGGVVMIGAGNLAMAASQAAMRSAGITIQGAGNAFVAGSNGTLLRRTGSNTSPAIEVQASGARIEKMRLNAVVATETLIKIKDNPLSVGISDVRGFAGGAQSRFLQSEGVTGLSLVDVETTLIGAVSVIQLTAEAHTANPISQVTFTRCRIGGDAGADLVAAVGNCNNVRVVSTDFVGGRDGWSLTKPAGWDALGAGSRTNPTEYQFDLVSWSGQNGHCSYWEFGRRIVFGSAVRSSNVGDATGHVFRSDVSDVVSGSAQHRGFGRSCLYWDGIDLTMSGTRIANWGNLSAAGSARPIGAIADSGGFVQLTIAVPGGRRQFDPWEWIRIESATGGLNGDHKITAVSGTTVTLATPFNVAFSVTSATARPVTAGVHIGPNAKDVDLNNVNIGRSDDASLLGQWCFLNESDGYVVWRPAGLDAGESGITRWVPDAFNATAAAKILAQTGEHREQGEVTFTSFGAASNLFVGAPNGVYAIVGFAARVTTSTTATIAAVRRTGTFTAGTPTVVVNTATWTRYMLSEPFLAKVGDGTTTDLGVRLVSATGSPATLDVRPIVMRLAPM